MRHAAVGVVRSAAPSVTGGPREWVYYPRLSPDESALLSNFGREFRTLDLDLLRGTEFRSRLTPHIPPPGLPGHSVAFSSYAPVTPNLLRRTRLEENGYSLASVSESQIGLYWHYILYSFFSKEGLRSLA